MISSDNLELPENPQAVEALLSECSSSPEGMELGWFIFSKISLPPLGESLVKIKHQKARFSTFFKLLSIIFHKDHITIRLSHSHWKYPLIKIFCPVRT